MLRKVMVFFAAAAVVMGLAPAARADVTTIKMGTLAPAESPWGTVFKVWQKGVDLKSNHAMKLQFFWNGQQGDEAEMVNKIKSGQIDGAALTAVGLGKLYQQVLVLQLPGLFSDWSKLDKARAALKTEFEGGLDTHGHVKVVGWGDVGRAHVMSKGFAVRVPKDMQGKKAYTIAGDPIGPALFTAIGGITANPISVMEILPNLNQGNINVVVAPSLAAEQLQWAPKLDNINSAVGAIGIGAVVISSPKLASLPADAQAILMQTGALAAAQLTLSIRGADDAAYGRLSAGPNHMTVYSPNAAEQAEWNAVFEKARVSLGGGHPFSNDIIAKVKAAAQ